MPDDSLEKVQSIIERSGNNFHSKVLQYFQANEWTVLISPYYNDNITTKPREIDLIAEKHFPLEFLRTYLGIVSIRLFIECKYIPQETVFWFHKKDKQKAEELVIEHTQLGLRNTYNKRHHYLEEGSEKVAKLFADGGRRSGDNELFYKALNQSLNATVYYRDRGSIIDYEPGSNTEPNIIGTLNFPIIVCNGFEKLYRVDIGEDLDPSEISDNFQLEINYAYINSAGNSCNEYFLIDILQYEQLTAFCEKLKKDAQLLTISHS